MEKENIVKKTCKELNLTYKQLGELIGYGEDAVSKASRTNNISSAMSKAINLYLENKELKEEVKKIETIIKLIDELRSK